MKKTLFLLLALPGMVHAEAQTATAVNDTQFYAATASKTGNVDVDVTSGTTGSQWAAAFGSAAGATLTGDASLRFSGEFTGASTVFGAVNTGSVTGDVTVVFDAENASYASFTDVGNGENEAVSLVGAFKANINGSFNAVINKGEFQYDILGGVHTGPNTIGSTHVTINGGTIADNVYAGGLTGTITGNTAITITNLSAVSTHTATNIISAGGKGGTIGGDSSVTFSGVNGTYAGAVSGGANVAGASTLMVDNNSTLVLGNVSDFDSFTVEKGSTLTVNGNIETDATLAFTYDAKTAATKTDNGLGAGILTGLVTGEGTFNLGEEATVNGMTVDGTNGKDFVINDSVYYVMTTPEVTKPEDGYYSYGNGVQVPIEEIVTVGNHNYSGPVATPEANSARGFYVGENGTLCVVGDSDTMTAATILSTTQGTGDIILRAPGYQDEYGLNGYTYEVTLQDKTRFAGDLYVSPYCAEQIADSDKTHIISQTGVVLYLEKGADVSSFASVNLCHTEACIVINGEIGRASEAVGHINDLTASGSGFGYLFINQGANKDLVLGGDTVIRSFTHADEEKVQNHITGGEQAALMRLVFNQGANVTIENLTTAGDTLDNVWWNLLEIDSSYGDKYAHADEINGVVNIESFDYLGSIYLNASITGSLHVNLNLLEGQELLDYQYYRSSNALGTQTLTITGEGTYILSEGNDILDKFGLLSTDFKDDNTRVWSGTVQMTNVDGTDSTNGTGRGIDFSYYGNEASYVDMRGFKGDVVVWAANGTVSETQPASVDIAPNLILTNTDKMVAYEVTGGIETQNYKGDISGEGDIVISAAESKNINLEGSINSWSGDLTVTNGTHNVQLANDAEAVVVKGTFSDAEDAALNLTVDTAKGTTFQKAFDVNSLTVNNGATAAVTTTSRAGNVQISGRQASDSATIANGMTITGNSISGGMAETATLTFVTDADNSVSSATLNNVALTSVTGSRVTLEDIEASEVYLMGMGVDFYSLVTQTQFTVTEAAVEGGKAFNEVRFESDIFDGMTLAKDGASATIGVSNEVEWGGFAANDALSNVTIMLTGFTLEGYNSGEGWPTENLIFDTGLSNGVADSGVSALLNLDLQKYDVVTYNQTAAGLEIRMEHLPSPTIPEPTTATLSLLALAALAARRRRR